MSMAAELDTAKKFLDQNHKMLIGGEWVGAQNGEQIDVIDPSTGKVISSIAAGDASDVDKAVKAAHEGFESAEWNDMKPNERMRMIHRIADLIEENADELACLETMDGGKPIQLSKPVDVLAAASAFRYYAGWADKIHGATHNISMPGEFHTYTLREPVGVAALIVPWNYPIVMAAMKLAPALAAGCACILKPAEDTSMTAIRLGELMVEAGVPKGIINVITGYGHKAGAALAAHKDIDKVAFTGSTATGKAIVEAARGNLKKVTLELGGKAPNIIMPDADLEKAIPGSALGIFWNTGQVCTAASRLYVHESKYDEVVAGIAEFSKTLKVGPALEEDVMLGPIVSGRQLDRVQQYIAKGSDEGGELVCGGQRIGDAGYFLEPTVIGNTKNSMTVVREEIFGPVLVAQRFSDMDEVIAMANDTEYGLSAVVWTENIGHGHRLAKRLKAGNVSVNVGSSADWDLPIGGFKQSGWGRENGAEGLANYLQTKAVVTAI